MMCLVFLISNFICASFSFKNCLLLLEIGHLLPKRSTSVAFFVVSTQHDTYRSCFIKVQNKISPKLANKMSRQIHKSLLFPVLFFVFLIDLLQYFKITSISKRLQLSLIREQELYISERPSVPWKIQTVMNTLKPKNNLDFQSNFSKENNVLTVK